MTQTTHLQGIGSHTAKQAQDFSIGETMVWNYGGTSIVTGITKNTPAFITFEIESNGKTYTRRLNKTRLVACI